MFLDVDGENDVFGNRLEFVLPRMMYLLDNSNFQTALYFNWFYMSTLLNMVEMIFVENVYFSGLAFCKATGRCICNTCKCMSLECCFYFSWNLQQTLETMCMYARAWFKHVAREKLREREKAQQVQWQVA